MLPLVDSTTRAGRALVVVPSGNGTLRPGMYADVRLEATRLPGRILVPSRAVIERDGRPLVFVVKDGRAQWVYIMPGRTNGVETEVLPDSLLGPDPGRRRRHGAGRRTPDADARRAGELVSRRMTEANVDRSSPRSRRERRTAGVARVRA